MTDVIMTTLNMTGKELSFFSVLCFSNLKNFLITWIIVMTPFYKYIFSVIVFELKQHFVILWKILYKFFHHRKKFC